MISNTAWVSLREESHFAYLSLLYQIASARVRRRSLNRVERNSISLLRIFCLRLRGNRNAVESNSMKGATHSVQDTIVTWSYLEHMHQGCAVLRTTSCCRWSVIYHSCNKSLYILLFMLAQFRGHEKTSENSFSWNVLCKTRQSATSTQSIRSHLLVASLKFALPGLSQCSKYCFLEVGRYAEWCSSFVVFHS